MVATPRRRSLRKWSGASCVSIVFVAVLAAVEVGGQGIDAKNEETATWERRLRRRTQAEAPPPEAPQPQPEAPQPQPEAPQPELARPVMHTFFSRLEGKREKGMNDEVDEQMLEVWKTAWAAAGWEPKVLTLEDAKKHPQFDRVNESLDGLPFGAYDRLCFLRWLAMAANGGGWMSDYDVFPLNPIAERHSPVTPNEGRFSVYDHQVPALVSGSSYEWDRMARLLVENAVQHSKEEFWSDMFAMVNLIEKHDPNVFISTRQVEIGSRVLTGEHFGEEDCAKLSDKVAIHFSHSAIHWAKLREGEWYGDRPRIASNWLKIYQERCSQAQVEVSGPTTA